MKWQKQIDSSLEELDGSIVYSKFRKFLPTLSENGFFTHLIENRETHFSRYRDILVYLGSHPNPSSIGLGMAGLAMANLSGNLLRLAGREKELRDLITGNSIFSFAVSEKGWKGKLSGIKTTISKPDSKDEDAVDIVDAEKVRESDQFLLNGKKGFATNGRQADSFLVLAKNPDSETGYSLVLIPKATAGLEIKPFDLDGLKEATHAELNFQDVKIQKEHFLTLDYKTHGKYLPIWELFSLQFLMLGLFQKIKKDKDVSKEHGKNLENIIEDWENQLELKFRSLIEEGISSLRLRDSKTGIPVLEYASENPFFAEKFPDLKIFYKLLNSR